MVSVRTWNLTSNTTLYAKWTINSYTLTVINGTPASAIQNYGTTLQVTASAGTSYTISYNVNGGTSSTPLNQTSTKTFSSWMLD
jgi:hypothetical protein